MRDGIGRQIFPEKHPNRSFRLIGVTFGAISPLYPYLYQKKNLSREFPFPSIRHREEPSTRGTTQYYRLNRRDSASLPPPALYSICRGVKIHPDGIPVLVRKPQPVRMICDALRVDCSFKQSNG